MTEPTKEQFARCFFNPLEKNLLEKNPGLKELIPAGLSHPEKVARYVCLLFDPQSPLVSTERDLNHRKVVAARMAGFDLDKDDFFLQGIYDGSEEAVVAVAVGFLSKCVKKMEWAYICALEAKYWEGIKWVMQPISKGDKGEKEVLQSVDIKAKIADELVKDLARIKQAWSEFFGNDDKMATVAQNTRITPESIAAG